jgi:hypothetical protein
MLRLLFCLVLQQRKTKEMNVSFSNHSKIIAPHSKKNEIRKFYSEVLQAKITKQTNTMDYFKIEDFFLAVIYDNTALSDELLLKSIWLEIKTDEPEKLKQSILGFGAKEVKSPMPHSIQFFFQAPGGQVFRVISTTEDMSRFEG